MGKHSRRVAYISTVRCDICGQFISIEDLEEGLAKRELITPASHNSKEEYETYHIVCDEEANNG